MICVSNADRNLRAVALAGIAGCFSCLPKRRYVALSRYAPRICPVHPISILIFVGFFFPYAGYLCVIGPHKFFSSVSVSIFKVCVL